MSTFDESKHDRDQTGKFTEMAGAEQDDALGTDTQGTRADRVAWYFSHRFHAAISWYSAENERLQDAQLDAYSAEVRALMPTARTAVCYWNHEGGSLGVSGWLDENGEDVEPDWGAEYPDGGLDTFDDYDGVTSRFLRADEEGYFLIPLTDPTVPDQLLDVDESAIAVNLHLLGARAHSDGTFPKLLNAAAGTDPELRGVLAGLTHEQYDELMGSVLGPALIRARSHLAALARPEAASSGVGA